MTAHSLYLHLYPLLPQDSIIIFLLCLADMDIPWHWKFSCCTPISSSYFNLVAAVTHSVSSQVKLSTLAIYRADSNMDTYKHCANQQRRMIQRFPHQLILQILPLSTQLQTAHSPSQGLMPFNDSGMVRLLKTSIDDRWRLAILYNSVKYYASSSLYSRPVKTLGCEHVVTPNKAHPTFYAHACVDVGLSARTIVSSLEISTLGMSSLEIAIQEM